MDPCECLSDEELVENEENVDTKPEPRETTKRNIILIDVDCFEYQVWVKSKYPDLEGTATPCVVVNPDGVILAVNYHAKKFGIVREPTKQALRKARELCPELKIIYAGTKEGLVDTDTPQVESDKIMNVLKKYCNTQKNNNVKLEISSKDECYLDVTQLVANTIGRRGTPGCKNISLPPQKQVDALTRAMKKFPENRFPNNPVTVMEGREGVIAGTRLNYRIRTVYSEKIQEHHLDEVRLVEAAFIAQTLQMLIAEGTGYEVSAGIGHNKLIAKLACSRNKPQGITIFTEVSQPRIMKSLGFQNLPKFGGITGKKLREQYKKDNAGKDLVTLADIQNIGHERILQLLKEIQVRFPESQSQDLMKKVFLQDDLPVRQRYYADTVNQSICFKCGYRTATTVDIFRNKVQALCKIFAGKLTYRLNHLGQEAALISVRARVISVDSPIILKPNYMTREKFQSDKDIFHFVLHYINTNGISFQEVLRIYLKGKNFQKVML